MSDVAAPPLRWRTNLLLFVVTSLSVFVTGVYSQGPVNGFPGQKALMSGAEFAGTLLLILISHELGHYVAARIHRVDASLPYFIPMPLLSPFGTMGAVIRMRGSVPTRRALFDIGASGPLAGLVFALPLYAWGVARSTLVVPDHEHSMEVGESLLMKLLDWAVAPPIPQGMDIQYSPMAWGAWGGLFVTMINLLPVGQLDGGHVAYALFGPKQDKYAVLVHRAMFVFFLVVACGHVARDVHSGGLYYAGRHLGSGMFWLVWFQVLAILGLIARREDKDDRDPATLTTRVRIVALLGLMIVASFARDSRSLLLPIAFFAAVLLLFAMEVKGGAFRKHDLLDHPATSPEPLDRVRAVMAVATLILFALLFIPEPFLMW